MKAVISAWARNMLPRILKASRSEKQGPKPLPPEEVLLATVSNDRFAPGTAVMLYSMKKHIPKIESYRIELFCDDTIDPLSEQNRSILKSIMPNLVITDISNEIYRSARCNPEHHRLAYLTLEVFRQTAFKRVIFFDGDMVTIGDFSAMFSIDQPLFGCQVGKKSRSTGIALSASINTGLFGISGSMLSNKTYEAILDVVMKRNDRYTGLLDQKTINKFRKHNAYPVYLLPYTYNYRDIDDEEQVKADLESIKTLHFSGYAARPKPWEYERRRTSGHLDHIAYTIWDRYAEELQQQIPQTSMLFSAQHHGSLKGGSAELA